MDKIIKRSVLLLLMLVFLVPNMQTMAASKKTLNKRALKAYKKVLEKRAFTWTSSYGSKWRCNAEEFTIIDVNRDGIKEMITQEDKWRTKFLWALKGKKAKPIAAFGSYQGCGIGYSKTYKAIVFPISMTVGTDADGFIRMKTKTKVTRFEWGTRYSYDSYTNRTISRSFWYIDGKSVTGSTFWKTAKANPSINRYSKPITFYRNSAANRKKMKKLKAY